jgi:hypothetical protein
VVKLKWVVVVQEYRFLKAMELLPFQKELALFTLQPALVVEEVGVEVTLPLQGLMVVIDILVVAAAVAEL